MVARSRNSVKDRQYNDKEKTDKRKNDHLIYKNATQTIKDRTTRPPPPHKKVGVTSCTYGVTLR